MFRPLQVIVSSFAALNHGGNDVGNCIGPLVTIWFVYQVQTQLYKCTVCVCTVARPRWVGARLPVENCRGCSGAGSASPVVRLQNNFYLLRLVISGLVVLGRRVITTVGTKLTRLTPRSCI